MGRELKRKQAKKNGQNVRDFSKNDNDSEMSMKKLLIILGVVVLIAIILYLFIGIVVTKEIDWFSNENENEVINKPSNAILASAIFRQTEEVTRQLRGQKQYAKTIAIIYKNNQFQNYSSQAKLQNPTNNTKEIYKLAVEIFDRSYKKDPIRLIGIRLADLTASKEKQLTLFEEEKDYDVEEEEFQKTIDDINKKFGKAILTPASLKMIGESNSKRALKNQIKKIVLMMI